MVAGLIGVRSVGRRVHPWPLGSSVCALGVFGFHLGSLRSLGCALVRGGWVYSGVPLRSSGSSWVAGFIRVLPGCRRVHPGLLGPLGCALGGVRFIRVL